jgi:hypothetical protein
MKNVKLFSKFMIIAATIVAISFAGCKKDDDEDPVNKAALVTKIADAETILNAAVEGTAQGQYLYGSKAEFQTKIDLAKAVNNDADATQVQVDNAVIALDQAIAEFDTKKVTPIAPDDLVGHWTFDEGTGTTANDYSGKNFHGMLKTGHTYFGAGTPEWTEDRYGNANKAIKFADGANVEVPFNSLLNPQEISISLWMKPDTQASPWANNYMVSLNRWNGYKLQLQDAPKVFFTVKAVDGGNEVYYDRDNEDPTINLGEWYHVTVTFKSGEMAFYLDGTPVKVWDNTPGAAIALDTPINLTIGQDLPTDIYSTDDTSPYFVNWGGYFKGVLDDVRIYKTALTSAQVQSIYNLEKP